MPRISIDNYDTVASWNGSQDLFIVEQPDGTKVATPAMIKQFIEAGDFEATGEVKDGNGNILADMAQASDVTEQINAVLDKLETDIRSVNLGRNQSATVGSNMNDYYAMLCICYVPGEGGLILGLRYTNGQSKVINLMTGAEFSSNYVTFTFSSTGVTVTSGNYTGYRFNFFRMAPYNL